MNAEFKRTIETKKSRVPPVHSSTGKKLKQKNKKNKTIFQYTKLDCNQVYCFNPVELLNLILVSCWTKK